MGRIPLTRYASRGLESTRDIPRATSDGSAQAFERPDLALQAIRSVDRKGSPPVEGLTMDLSADGPIEPVSVVEESSSIRKISIDSDSILYSFFLKLGHRVGWRNSMGKRCPCCVLAEPLLGWKSRQDFMSSRFATVRKDGSLAVVLFFGWLVKAETCRVVVFVGGLPLSKEELDEIDSGDRLKPVFLRL